MGSCFNDRPYCAASPQASHRACPALGLATKELYTKTCALYPRSQERSLTAHPVNIGRIGINEDLKLHDLDGFLDVSRLETLARRHLVNRPAFASRFRVSVYRSVASLLGVEEISNSTTHRQHR